MLIYSYYSTDFDSTLQEQEYIKNLLKRFTNYIGPNGIVYSADKYKLVDKSKFDIIEKKDAKIERIKKNIEELLAELDTKSKEVDEEISRMEKIKETIEGLNKELKELEDK